MYHNEGNLKVIVENQRRNTIMYRIKEEIKKFHSSVINESIEYSKEEKEIMESLNPKDSISSQMNKLLKFALDKNLPFSNLSNTPSDQNEINSKEMDNILKTLIKLNAKRMNDNNRDQGFQPSF